MSETETGNIHVELVGGPKDGERLAVPAESGRFLRFAYMSSPPKFDDPPDKVVTVEELHYLFERQVFGLYFYRYIDYKRNR